MKFALFVVLVCFFGLLVAGCDPENDTDPLTASATVEIYVDKFTVIRTKKENLRYKPNGDVIVIVDGKNITILGPYVPIREIQTEK